MVFNMNKDNITNWPTNIFVVNWYDFTFYHKSCVFTQNIELETRSRRTSRGTSGFRTDWFCSWFESFGTGSLETDPSENQWSLRGATDTTLVQASQSSDEVKYPLNSRRIKTWKWPESQRNISDRLKRKTRSRAEKERDCPLTILLLTDGHGHSALNS